MKRRTKRLIFCGLVVLMVASLFTLGGFAGCAPEEEAPAPPPPEEEAPGPPPPAVSEWNIPVMGALTGPLAFQGIENKKYGYDRAAAEINAAGGIRGIPITFTEYDCGWDPAKAVAIMPQMVAGSLIVLGPGATTDLQASAHIAVEEGVFLLAACCDDDVAELFAPWAQTLNPSVPPVCRYPATEWLRLNPDIKSIVLIYHPEIAAMIDMMGYVAEAAESMDVETKFLEVPIAAIEFGATAVKAIDLGVDGFWVTMMPESAAKQMVELHNRGVTEGRRMMLGPALIGPTFLDIGGEALEDVYVTGMQNPDYDGRRFQAIIRDYAADNNGSVWPAQSVWAVYDAVYLIKEAFEACNITGDPAKLAEERIAIRDYIRGLHGEKRFQSVRGKDVELIMSGVTLPSYLFQLEKDSTAVMIAKLPGAPGE